MQSLVTAVIPVYNSAKYVREAIESASNQTYKNIEIIIVNDGSTDNTAEIIKKLMAHSSELMGKVRYIYQENKGPAAARNRGIREAKGEYIVFLDADDEWLPDKLEKQIKLLNENRNVGLVTCGRDVIDQLGKKTISLPKIPVSRQKMLMAFTLGNIVGSCSCVMLRKTCLNGVGCFDESLKVGEDWDLWLRIAREFDIEVVNEPLVKYNLRPNSQSGSGDINLKNELQLLEKIFNEPSMQKAKTLRNKAYSQRYYKAAIAYRENGNVEKMKKAISESLQLYPFHIFNKAIFSFYLKSLVK